MAQDARIALRTNIERTRQQFHRLLNMMPEAALTQPSKNPAWTNGELLTHMCMAPRRMLSRMKNVVDQSWVYPPLLKLSPRTIREIHIRYKARTSTILSLGIEFDKTCLFALKLLEEMWDQDFESSLFVDSGDALLSGKVTRQDIFDYLSCYFETHSKQLDFYEKRQSPSAFQMAPHNSTREQPTGHQTHPPT